MVSNFGALYINFNSISFVVCVGLIGKPSSGKSTFFKALTSVETRIAPYPFSTVEVRVAEGFATVPCPCRKFGLECGFCSDGVRPVRVKVADLPGLVPGSHAGRGMGNRFLSEVSRARVLIHVLDSSGTTDCEGNPGAGDPVKDAEFIEEELDRWFEANLGKTSLGLPEGTVPEPGESVRDFRRRVKPVVLAANKADLPESRKFIRKLEGLGAVPCSALFELVLRKAAASGIVRYVPDNGFELTGRVSARQLEALERVRRFIETHGSTGVQECLNRAVFEKLGYIAVFPVENEKTLTDSSGRVLPDVYLLPPDSTARDLAFRIHTDLGKRFVRAVSAVDGTSFRSEDRLRHLDVLTVRKGQ